MKCSSLLKRTNLPYNKIYLLSSYLKVCIKNKILTYLGPDWMNSWQNQSKMQIIALWAKVQWDKILVLPNKIIDWLITLMSHHTKRRFPPLDFLTNLMVKMKIIRTNIANYWKNFKVSNKPIIKIFSSILSNSSKIKTKATSLS